MMPFGFKSLDVTLPSSVIFGLTLRGRRTDKIPFSCDLGIELAIDDYQSCRL
jgi:hypothetical protein